MDIEHSDEAVRKWSSANDARGLHDYLEEEHGLKQGPHMGSEAAKRRSIKPLLFGIAIVVLAIILTGTLFFTWLFSPTIGDGVGTPFVIEPGTPVPEIVAGLEFGGYVKNAWSILFILRLEGVEDSVKAGTFTLSPAMTPAEIVAIITDAAPPEKDLSVTIPEGFTATETALRVVEAGLLDDAGTLLDAPIDISEYPFVDTGSCSSGDGTDCTPVFSSLEGYLFPDTYRFKTDASPQDIADRFLKNFSAQFNDAYQAEALASGKSLREIVTIASLVEEEARHDEDRAKIAGIIEERLALGMLLQIDATVLYAQERIMREIPGARFDSVDRELTFSDLEVNSPYNTYQYGGLPPGPITNPGLASLIGALRPEKSEYLYYLHDEDGNTHFGRTLEEHIANRNRYLR